MFMNEIVEKNKNLTILSLSLMAMLFISLGTLWLSYTYIVASVTTSFEMPYILLYIIIIASVIILIISFYMLLIL